MVRGGHRSAIVALSSSLAFAAGCHGHAPQDTKAIQSGEDESKKNRTPIGLSIRTSNSAIRLCFATISCIAIVLEESGVLYIDVWRWHSDIRNGCDYALNKVAPGNAEEKATQIEITPVRGF